MTGSVTIKAVDLANRRVTLTSATGEEKTFDVPAEYHNFDRLKAGDTIMATYTREAEITVSSRDARTPADAATQVTARAAQGEQPAVLVANKIVVTGVVLDKDMANHTLRLVSVKGGEVVTVPVTRPEGREAMGRLKAGDKVTATITEGLLLAVANP